ncbi:hypothetical protein DPMN_053530 [Dreissena polymorpha]|uniref:Uncharacterized protein n=1 Tax=Dreissena polymorpha TaxID=45954 RepID=A0A9D4CMS9_DREPO|nr:hypothetical protein DPMN_053530 [Dreissena polymorpha]
MSTVVVWLGRFMTNVYSGGVAGQGNPTLDLLVGSSELYQLSYVFIMIRDLTFLVEIATHSQYIDGVCTQVLDVHVRVEFCTNFTL